MNDEMSHSLVIWPGRLTVDFASHWQDRAHAARGRVVAVISDQDDAERDHFVRSVAARVPVPMEDVEDADAIHSDVVVKRSVLVVAGKAVRVSVSRRDPIAAFNERTAERRYRTARDLENTHPAFEDRRAAKAAMRQARRDADAAEHEYQETCSA